MGGGGGIGGEIRRLEREIWGGMGGDMVGGFGI
jgi:hypothetical protein